MGIGYLLGRLKYIPSLAFCVSGVLWGECMYAQPLTNITVESQIQTVELVCVPANGKVSSEYRKVIFAGTPSSTMCKCDSSTPYSKELLGAITIGGAYKLVKFTHDTTPKMVAEQLKLFEVGPIMLKRFAPGITKAITSRRARQASLAGLIATVVIVVEEAFTDHALEKALKNEPAPRLMALISAPREIYTVNDVGKPECLTGTNKDLEVHTYETVTVPNQWFQLKLGAEEVRTTATLPLRGMEIESTHEAKEPSKGEGTVLPFP
jgi:hypothetical protein